MNVLGKLTLLLSLATLLRLTASAQTHFAVLQPDGAWTWFNDPRALFHHGQLYFGYVRFSDGRSALDVFNPQTGASSNLWTGLLTQKDDHNNPGLLVKQDGRLLAIYARHGSDPFFSYRLSLTTNPVTAADWTAEQTIAATGAGVTYANPFQLSDEGGLIYNFMRNLNFNPTVTTSTDGGSNWAALRLFIQAGGGSIRPYVKYCSNGTNRIDFLYTDGHPRDVNNSLYHLYYQNGTLFQTDGTVVKSFSEIPLLHDIGERGAVIYQFNSAPSSDPNQHIQGGRAWCWETAYQANGDPVSVFTVQRDQVMGTNWFDDRIYYYYARWTGTNWQKRFVAHAGRPLYASEDDYAGGICVDPENANAIYIASNAADPFNLSNTTNVVLRANDRYEIWKGTTSDGGLTFSWQPVTSNSSADNLRPYVPRRHGGTPALIWFRGTYSTYANYNCAVVGVFSTPVPQAPSISITNPSGRPAIITNLNNKLKLGATATDDGAPGPISISWSTVSGPANALFTDETNATTLAGFPLAGTYVLRATASDTALTGFAEVTVQAGGVDPGPDSQLRLWLELDEQMGTNVADSSGYAHAGVLSGGAGWLPAGGQKGGALNVDGTNGQAIVADADGLDNTSAFTLAYWFRADAYPGDSAGLVSKRDNISSQNAYTTYLKASDKRIYVDIVNSNDRFSSTALIELGTWYHVAVVFDGSLPSVERATLWINGALDTTATESSAAVPNYTSSVRLGNTHPGAVNWFDGRIDEVQFFQRALSAAELALMGATNYGPSVTTGAPLTATNGIAANLNGSVVDDDRGGPLTMGWTKAIGPGAAFFQQPSSPVTQVTFGRPGAYLLRLAASDSRIEVAGELPVEVSPNPKIYEDWIALAFPGISNVAVTGISADPDQDGVKNLMEFALGMTPGQAGLAGLPAGLVLTMGAVKYLALLVRRPVGLNGIVYAAQASSDFNTWSAGTQEGAPVPQGDGTELVTFRDTQPLSQAGQRFMRLRVTKL